MSIGDQMKSRIRTVSGAPLKFLVSSCLALLVPVAFSSGQEKVNTGAPAQRTFATPKQAVDALLQVCDPYDVTGLKQILGPQDEDLVSSEDPVRDQQTCQICCSQQGRGRRSSNLLLKRDARAHDVHQTVLEMQRLRQTSESRCRAGTARYRLRYPAS